MSGGRTDAQGTVTVISDTGRMVGCTRRTMEFGLGTETGFTPGGRGTDKHVMGSPGGRTGQPVGSRPSTQTGVPQPRCNGVVSTRSPEGQDRVRRSGRRRRSVVRGTTGRCPSPKSLLRIVDVHNPRMVHGLLSGSWKVSACLIRSGVGGPHPRS